MHYRHASALCLSLWLGLLVSHPLAAAEPDALEIGILPTMSTRTILTTYQPLREYLQTRLKRPVILVTAPDYHTYIDRTQHGEYRFLVTAPHFARLAQQEAGYQPLVRVKRQLHGVVVVQNDSVHKELGDLRGKVVASPEDVAIITMLGLELLKKNGLTSGKDVTIQPLPSFNAAILAVQNKQAAAAITAPTALKQMSETLRASLRVIGTTESTPHVIFMANRNVPRPEAEAMTQALLDFEHDQRYGTAFFEQTGFQGYQRTTAAEMRSLDPYVTELKRQLRRAP
jgi:phosphonate transport system substrate-binding protein